MTTGVLLSTAARVVVVPGVEVVVVESPDSVTVVAVELASLHAVRTNKTIATKPADRRSRPDTSTSSTLICTHLQVDTLDRQDLPTVTSVLSLASAGCRPANLARSAESTFRSTPDSAWTAAM